LFTKEFSLKIYRLCIFELQGITVSTTFIDNSIKKIFKNEEAMIGVMDDTDQDEDTSDEDGEVKHKKSVKVDKRMLRNKG